MNQAEKIKQHCKTETKRSEAEATTLYTERLNSAIDKSVYEPFCKPVYTENRERERIWVNSSTIRVRKGFDFYHHTPEQLVEYAVKHRGDYNLLIKDMDRLFLSEYPAPNGEGNAYFVSQNGNHRRLVYECIGLSQVSAGVYRIKDNESWTYYIGGKRNTANKILNWLKKIGLIEEYNIVDFEKVTFRGTKNIAAWILPDLRHGTTDDLVHEMQERLELLEKSFYPITHKSFRIIKSKILWRLSMTLAWFFREK